MRFFPVFFLLPIMLFPLTVLAQDVPEEYKNVPQGLLLPEKNPIPVVKTPPPGEETGNGEAMTIEDLETAYRLGKYDQIIARVVSLAKKGHPLAEELLGVMYHNGQGVPKDPAEALKWLTAAAGAGRPLAQHHLAIMAFAGEGVEQDSARALMWLHIAILYYPDGPEKRRAKTDRDNILPQLSRRDKDRALELAREWLEKRGDALLLDLQ